MKTINVTNVRKDIYNLVNGVIENHEPLRIISKHGNVILISEEDYDEIISKINEVKR